MTYPEMEIVREKPPIWDRAHRAFEIDDANTVFTYGNKIFNPAGVEIDDALFAHEQEHGRQQSAYFGGPSAWWDAYFTDPVFRAEQEVEAYAAQYAEFCSSHTDRNARTRYLSILGGFLSGGTYKLIMSPQDARNAILKRSERHIER